MLLWSLMITLIILLWNTNPHWEWRVPLKLQRYIHAGKETLERKTKRIVYDRKKLREDELEKSIRDLHKEFFRLHNIHHCPVWIEVLVDQTMSLEPRNKYLACLQRRFPDIEISASQQEYGELG
ncbi:hypothetical protein [Desulfosporosinus sp. FKA]|uniref:hypothetical protein n=1 Tax=Desulfosporosinus sp. FKA TaxID=1969834 RepID=UPI000B499330|nr:hypothetical protein [Desulfosporosinus sp. FKA]